jgi:hypothetical protein
MSSLKQERAASWAVASLCVLLVAACQRNATQGEKSEREIRSATDATTWRYVSAIESGRRRVYITDASGNDRLLIRSFDAAAGADGISDTIDWSKRELESTREWMACKARVSSGTLADPLIAHDAWLETAERLEKRLQLDPDHLGVLRGLIAAYAHVLSFETNTALGSNICLLGGRRISEFERKASPLGPDDKRLVDDVRSAIFYAMKLYPSVLDYLQRMGDANRARPLREALVAIGQEHYSDAGGFSVGALTVRIYRNSGMSPDPRLLWEKLYFVISGRDLVAPESTTAYVLVQQGAPGREHHYLYFRAANRSQLVLIYGRNTPYFLDLRKWVEASVRSAVASDKGGKE